MNSIKYAMLFIACAIFSLKSIGQDQMFDICPLKVGQETPEASILDQDGETITLEALTAPKPTILIFYRGAWCGYCNKHLSELNEIKDKIDSLDFQIFGITVDQSSKIEHKEDEIKVYSDAKLEATKAFGLDWQLDDAQYEKYKKDYDLDLEEWSGEEHHSLPVPAVYIIKNNQVAFQYVNPNYNTRLKKETLLAVLKTLVN